LSINFLSNRLESSLLEECEAIPLLVIQRTCFHVFYLLVARMELPPPPLSNVSITLIESMKQIPPNPRNCNIGTIYTYIPSYFMTVALASHLTEKGMTVGETGWLLAMSTLPWTFKLFWAPVIDSVTIGSMGRRRPWILLAQLMMAVTMIALVLIGNASEELTLLGWLFFIHNCFASLQDVSTDALAIDILAVDERGRVNGMMWASKILGVGFGSAAMGTLLARTNLEVTVMAQTAMILIIMMLPLWFRERPGEKRFPWSRSQVKPVAASPEIASVRNPIHVLSNLLRGYSLPATAVAAIVRRELNYIMYL